ncbi:MAG: class I SAM-dependent methyltransferase, partial [Thermomicrobiaceae bacterium]
DNQSWAEQDSQKFIELSELVVPSRDEQARLICDLIPADPGEHFMGLDIACGEGKLSRAILERYPDAQMTLLDGSEAMLTQAAENLGEYAYQIDLRPFDLFESDWLAELPKRFRCIVSSLAIHHLNENGKRELYGNLFEHLVPGGALLVADLVHPPNELVGEAWANEWDRDVREQSLARTGSLLAFDQFQDGWNHYRTPDYEFDKPSRLFDQLSWLQEIGFVGVDCFWLRAGHAVFGGYRPS